MGWPGMAKHVAGADLAKASATAALTEPTSVIVAPGFRALATWAADGPMARGGVAKMTRSASRTASLGSSATTSAKPSATIRSRARGLAS